MSAPAVVVAGLEVVLGGVGVLENVSLEVAAGEFVAVIGPNGAGKTTLIRCLDGLVEPADGTVEVAGLAVAGLDRRELAKRVSYVPQTSETWVGYTVRTFVELGRYPHLGTWESLGSADRAAVDDALGWTATRHLAERRLDTLSGGERQRVLIAAALAQGGDILLLDEPTTFLDFRHQTETVALLARLHREQGLTVVAVTHDLNGTAAAADSILALRDGRVCRRGTAAELFTRDALQSVYETDFLVVPTPGRPLPLVHPLGGDS